MENQVKPRVTVQMILADLEAGLTRTDKDKHFKPELGSIQSKYSLSTTELKAWFTHAKLKGRKVKGVNKNPFQYELVDEDEVEVPHVEMEEVVSPEPVKVVDDTPEAEVVQEEAEPEFKGF